MAYLFDYRVGHGRTYRLPLFAARYLARRMKGWDWDTDRPECLGCTICGR